MLARMRFLIRGLFSRRRMESEMDAELRSHLESYADDLVASGVAPAEAERRARLEFGAVESFKEECREARGLRWFDELARNVRFAFRIFRKAPVFSVAAVLTLALCIGANTAIFSVVDALMFRPLPYPEPERLGMLSITIQGKGIHGDQESFDGRGWQMMRDSASAIRVAAMGMPGGANFVLGDRAEYAREHRVSAAFFPVLGVAPALGRTFSDDEDRPGGPNAAVLSFDFWKRALGGDPLVIGRAVRLRGAPYTVIGVMPAGFRAGEPADLWTPLRPSTSGEGHGLNYAIIARVRPGITWEQAVLQTELAGRPLVEQLKAWQYIPQDVQARVRLLPLQHATGAGTRPRVMVLWAGVGLVLLIGCVNIAGLLLAHGAARRREIATRMALGGGRAAVVRQLLTESFVLAILGSAAGVLLGWLGIEALQKYIAETSGIWQTIEWNGRLLGAVALLTFLTTAIFGVAPALEAARADFRSALAEGGNRTAAGGRLWPRRALVLAEVALGAVLLIAAGLLLRSFWHLRGLTPGFQPAGVLTAKVSLKDARYRTSESVNRLFETALAAVRRLPGVQYAAVGLGLPYERPLNLGFRRIDGPNADSEQNWNVTNFFYVTPEYFQALGITLRRGREFARFDGPNSARVVIVNEMFARKFFSNQEAVGSHLAFGRDRMEVVGVVGDVQQRPDWGDAGAIEPMPAAYIPAAQASADLLELVHVWLPTSWVVKTRGAAGGLLAGLTRAIREADRQLPVADVQSMEEVRSASMRGHRVQATVLAVLAGLALILAAVGVYGLIANTVTARTRELGIRLAIGATPGGAVRNAAAPGVVLALGGVAIGCVLAAIITPLLRHLLYGVQPGDAATYATVALLLLAASAVASILPAARIARLNPADTLRHD